MSISLDEVRSWKKTKIPSCNNWKDSGRRKTLKWTVNPNLACQSVEDKKALKRSCNNQWVKLEDGHYQVALPWRAFPSISPYNRSTAEQRLVPELQDHCGKVLCRRSCYKGITWRAWCEGQASMVSASSHGAEYALVSHKSPIRAIRKWPRGQTRSTLS